MSNAFSSGKHTRIVLFVYNEHRSTRSDLEVAKHELVWAERARDFRFEDHIRPENKAMRCLLGVALEATVQKDEEAKHCGS